MNKKFLFCFIFIFCIVSDHFSKSKVVEYFHNKVGSGIVNVIDGFLSIGYTKNEGVAFGMMANWSDGIRSLALVLTSLVAFIVLLKLMIVYKNNKIAISCFALIFGGAIGNIADRAMYGAVVDFIDVYYKNHHWPMFNLADSFICIGVITLIFLPSENKVACENDIEAKKEIREDNKEKEQTPTQE